MAAHLLVVTGTILTRAIYRNLVHHTNALLGICSIRARESNVRSGEFAGFAGSDARNDPWSRRASCSEVTNRIRHTPFRFQFQETTSDL